MKNLILLSILFLFAGSLRGQCNPTLSGNETVITSNVTSNTPQRFLICSGSTLTYDTVSSFQIYFYVEDGATLHLKGSQIANVWLAGGATLNLDTTGRQAFYGPFIQWVHYDSSNVTLIDTGDGIAPMWTHCAGQTFDYANFPGGTSPCGPATITAPATPGLTFYPQPAADVLQIGGALHEVEQYRILSLAGEEVSNWHPLTGNQIYVGGMAAGIYLLQWENSSGIRQTQKLMKE